MTNYGERASQVTYVWKPEKMYRPREIENLEDMRGHLCVLYEQTLMDMGRSTVNGENANSRSHLLRVVTSYLTKLVDKYFHEIFKRHTFFFFFLIHHFFALFDIFI